MSLSLKDDFSLGALTNQASEPADSRSVLHTESLTDKGPPAWVSPDLALVTFMASSGLPLETSLGISREELLIDCGLFQFYPECHHHTMPSFFQKRN